METTNLVDIELRFIRAQESRNLSPYTIRNYRQFFIELHRYEQERGVSLRGDSLTNDILRDVAVWLRQAPLRKPRNGRTTRNSGGLLVRLRQLRALVRWLQAEGLTNQSLFVKLPSVPQQVRESLTEAQVGKLWESSYLTGHSVQSARNRALLALMLTSGLRVAEVAGIEDRDFSWDDGIVVVTGKGDKERYVPVSRETEALIRIWMRRRDAEPVEVRGKGRGKTFELARTGIQELCRKISRDVGFVFSPHRLRHTMALSYIRQGMDPFHLKRILGHKHIETTLVYVNLNTDDLRRKHAQFTPVHLVPLTPQTESTPPTRKLRLIKES